MSHVFDALKRAETELSGKSLEVSELGNFATQLLREEKRDHAWIDDVQLVSPSGQVLAGPCFEGETILTADLDLNDIGRGKFDFDVVGHYARPDVFQLVVNEAPMSPVRPKSGSATS